MKNKKIKNFFGIILIIFLVISGGVLLADEEWTGPECAAPGCNVSAPVNISDAAQVKTGGLAVGSFIANSDAIFNGKIGIGTTSPSAKLEVVGDRNDSITTSNATTKFGGSDVYLYGESLNSTGHYAHALQVMRDHDSASFPLSLQPNGGNVGIGTTSPSSKLEVNGWYGRSAHNVGGLLGSYNNVGNNSAKTNPIYVIGSNYKPNESDLNNMYGIGYTHSNASFINDGDGWGMYVAADGDSRIFLSGSSGKVYANAYLYNSDINLKKNIKKLENYRDILKIDAVRFDWRKNEKHDVGIIAQEVQKYFPEFVHQSGDHLAVDYPKLSVPMLNLLQEQEERLNNLESKNKQQEERLNKQEKEIKELKEMIQKLQK